MSLVQTATNGAKTVREAKAVVVATCALAGAAGTIGLQKLWKTKPILRFRKKTVDSIDLGKEKLSRDKKKEDTSSTEEE